MNEDNTNKFYHQTCRGKTFIAHISEIQTPMPKYKLIEQVTIFGHKYEWQDTGKYNYNIVVNKSDCASKTFDTEEAAIEDYTILLNKITSFYAALEAKSA